MNKVKLGINCRVCIDCLEMTDGTSKSLRCYGERNGVSLKRDFDINYIELPEVAPDWCPHRKQMTIDEAIEILKRRHGELEAPIDGEMKHALGLGIEALKVVQQSRVKYSRSAIYPLPSETEG